MTHLFKSNFHNNQELFRFSYSSFRKIYIERQKKYNQENAKDHLIFWQRCTLSDIKSKGRKGKTLNDESRNHKYLTKYNNTVMFLFGREMGTNFNNFRMLP